MSRIIATTTEGAIVEGVRVADTVIVAVEPPVLKSGCLKHYRLPTGAI